MVKFLWHLNFGISGDEQRFTPYTEAARALEPGYTRFFFRGRAARCLTYPLNLMLPFTYRRHHKSPLMRKHSCGTFFPCSGTSPEDQNFFPSLDSSFCSPSGGPLRMKADGCGPFQKEVYPIFSEQTPRTWAPPHSARNLSGSSCIFRLSPNVAPMMEASDRTDFLTFLRSVLSPREKNSDDSAKSSLMNDQGPSFFSPLRNVGGARRKIARHTCCRGFQRYGRPRKPRSHQSFESRFPISLIPTVDLPLGNRTLTDFPGILNFPDFSLNRFLLSFILFTTCRDYEIT